MPIGTPVEEDRTTPSAGASLAITGNTIAGGKALFLLVGSPASGKIVTSVTDDAGNIWTVDATKVNGAAGASMISSPNPNGLTAGQTITVNFSPSTTQTIAYWIISCTGVSSTIDQSASGSGSSTAPLTASTGTLANANELVWGLVAAAGTSTWTKGASYTNTATPSQPSRIAVEYKIVSSNTAVTADGTLGTSRVWAAIVATYPQSAVVAANSNMFGLF